MRMQLVRESLVYVQATSAFDKNIVLITVVPGIDKPYSYDNKIYVSQGDSSYISVADMNETMELYRQSNKRSLTWEKMIANDIQINQLDEALIKEVIEQGGKTGRLDRRIKDVVDFLEFTQLIDYSAVRNGGVAVFALNAEKFFPQLQVRVKIADQGITAKTIGKEFILSGNILKIHKELMDFYQRELNIETRYNDLSGKSEKIYVLPNDVYDELITNALVHSDYSNSHDFISLTILPNRIECVNPGRIPNEVLESIAHRSHLSLPHNPAMANVCYMNDLMELSGRGLSTIMDGMLLWGCKSPEWQQEGRFIRTTIYTDTQNSPHVHRIVSFRNSHAIGFEFSRSEYNNVYPGISERTAKNDIQKMIQLNFCEQTGAGSSTKYRIIAR